MPGCKQNKNSRSRYPGRLLKRKYVNYITVREFAPRHLKQNQKTNALSEANTFEARLFVVKIVVRILFFVTVRHFYPDVSRRFCF